MKYKNSLIQLIKYGIVGSSNTILTAFVIWIIQRFVFHITDESNASTVEVFVPNICGYSVGLINSFVLNRSWTFKNKKNWKKSFFKFLLSWGICYFIQFAVVMLLNLYVPIPSITYEIFNWKNTITSLYLCQLTGIVTFVGLNFFFNKYFAFKP